MNTEHAYRELGKAIIDHYISSGDSGESIEISVAIERWKCSGDVAFYLDGICVPNSVWSKKELEAVAATKEHKRLRKEEETK